MATLRLEGIGWLIYVNVEGLYSGVQITLHHFFFFSSDALLLTYAPVLSNSMVISYAYRIVDCT